MILRHFLSNLEGQTEETGLVIQPVEACICSPQKSDAKDAFKRCGDSRKVGVKPDERVCLDIQAVAGQQRHGGRHLEAAQVKIGAVSKDVEIPKINNLDELLALPFAHILR